MLTNLTKILPLARQKGYAVPHFNFSDLEVAQGVMAAAVELKSPVIFGTSEGAIKYAGTGNLVDIVKNLAEKYPAIPVVLHLDHGASFETCKKSIKAGYTSVMIDASKLPFKENIKLTKEVAEYAHREGVSVEGELGTVAKPKEVIFPTGEEAREFIEKTRVDALAVGVGTAHGLPVPDERIHFDVLKDVADAVDLPLVLHGGSNLPSDQVKKAIKMGISKVNIDTELRQAFTGKIRKELKDRGILDPREYLGDARQAVKKAATRKIRELGSNNRA